MKTGNRNFQCVVWLMGVSFCAIAQGQQLPATLPCTPDAARGPCAPCIKGVECSGQLGREPHWLDAGPIDFGPMGPGEYVGPARWSPAQEQRLRAGDEVRLTYVSTHDQQTGSYRLMTGDTIAIDSTSEDDLKNTNERSNVSTVQPDGTISVRMLGEIQAAGLTFDQLRKLLEKRYTKYYKDAKIDVVPQKTNTKLTDLLQAVGGQSGFNPPNLSQKLALDGKIRLPLIGAVCVQDLTLDELKTEVNLRYKQIVTGLEVEPSIAAQAPHFIYVLGEVNLAGRFELQAPTTALGALALASGDRLGGNLRQIVIIRRADDWRMMATMVDLRGAILGKSPTPVDNIWLRDGDIVIVPRTPVRIVNNFVRMVFTEGLYGVIPFSGVGISLGNNNN